MEAKIKLPEKAFSIPRIEGAISEICTVTHTRVATDFVLASASEKSENFLLSISTEKLNSVIVEVDGAYEHYDTFADWSFIFIPGTTKARVYIKDAANGPMRIRLIVSYTPPLLVESIELFERLQSLGRFRMLTPSPHKANLIRCETAALNINLYPIGQKVDEPLDSLFCANSNDRNQPAQPKYISLESTGYCNLTCVHCPQGVDGGMPYPDKTVSQRVISTLSAALKNSKEVVLNGYGEPLASGRIWQILEMLEGSGSHVGFNTNGHLLNKKIVGKILAAKALKFIHVSVDAATAGTYYKIRGDDFCQLIQNINFLNEQLAKSGRKDLEVRISMVLMRENLSELVKFIELAAQLNVAAMIWNLKENNSFFGSNGFETIQEWFVQRGDWEFRYADQLPHKDPDFNAHVTSAIEVAKSLNVTVYGLSDWPNELFEVEEDMYSGLESKPSDCIYLDDRLFVLSNGDARMCCYQIDMPPIANLNFSSVDEVWNGDALNSTKEMLRKNLVPKSCSKATCIYIRGK